ncbi:MAG TPA: substrate-binding domain-containing protein [Burkholderiales bacterium]|nr:substrate-binding domain-containing protein [Burkholderiales bacterium]
MPSKGVVRVLSPSAVHSSLEAIVEAHRGRGGGEVALRFETAPTLIKLVAGGESADIIIAPPRVMDELVGMGKADPDGRFQLGRAGVGVCVRDGAPFPDVASTEALKRAILDAESVFHTQASSGIYVAQLLERLGVAAQIKGRIRSYHDAQETFTHLLGSKGRDIGFGGLPEIRRWHDRGLRLVAPLPSDIQNYTAYLAALMSDPPNGEGARAFFKFLASAEAKALLIANGVD